MPKRTDIKSILIIGAGPIVIGQACEFDYSGRQACKALRQEGYKVILVNSNPATIMTDPEMADVTYIEPITWQMVEKIIAKEAPDAILPTMGGQTALNCALDLHKHGVLAKHGVEMIGANERAIEKAEDRLKFKDAMTSIGLDSAKSGIAHSWEEAQGVQKHIATLTGGPGFPVVIRPSFTLGGTGGGIAYNPEEFEEICKRGPRSVAHQGTADRRVADRLERVRDGGGARQGRQLHHRLLDREPRPDGHPHRRFHHRGAGADAQRQGIPADAQRLDRDPARDRRRYRRLRTCSSRSIPTNGRMIVIEMNPRVSARRRWHPRRPGFPIAKIAAKLAVGYTLDELRNDITGGATPASFEPSIDYVVTKIPRFAFEKFREADPHLTTQMKSVGEVMAMGRTFQESFQKALRGLETGHRRLERRETDREEIKEAIGNAGPERILYVGDAFRIGLTLDEVQDETAIDPWFLRRSKS
jgi:carbamoyl-phosphate synthase large subunit